MSELEGTPIEGSLPPDTEMAETTTAEGDASAALPFAEGVEEEESARQTFMSYLMSPVVSLLVGAEGGGVLTAHQALLEKSPYFKDACAAFAEDGSVGFSFASSPLLYLLPMLSRRASGQRERERASN